MEEPPKCRLCLSTRGVLSEEHIPPKSTGNAGPATVEYHRASQDGVVQEARQDGLALRVLCQRCNNRFGSRLGTTFADFVKQVQVSGRFVSLAGGFYVRAMEIFPARVHRQLLLNYLCMHNRMDPAISDPVRAYVRSRRRGGSSRLPRIALYVNASATYRIVPTGAVSSLGGNGEPWVGAELAAPGLGVVFTQGDGGTRGLTPKEPVDISAWGSRDFDARESITLTLPKFRVEVPHPLGYGTRREVDRWQTTRTIAWLASGAGDGDGPTQIGALWRTGRGRKPRR